MRYHIIEKLDEISSGQSLFAASSVDQLSSSDSQKVTANDIARKLNLLQAMRTIVKGWDSVIRSAIVNCWRKAGFEAENIGLQDEPEIASPPEMTNEEFSAWVDVDRDTPICEELTFEEEQQLINNIIGRDEVVVIDSDDDDADKLEDVPSNAEMRHCLRRLHVGLEKSRLGVQVHECLRHAARKFDAKVNRGLFQTVSSYCQMPQP